MGSDNQKQLASSWRGPASVCVCGHLGDGSDSEHAGGGPTIGNKGGHGACRVCKCQQFTWKDFTKKFKTALARAKAGG